MKIYNQIYDEIKEGIEEGIEEVKIYNAVKKKYLLTVNIYNKAILSYKALNVIYYLYQNPLILKSGAILLNIVIINIDKINNKSLLKIKNQITNNKYFTILNNIGNSKLMNNLTKISDEIKPVIKYINNTTSKVDDFLFNVPSLLLKKKKNALEKALETANTINNHIKDYKIIAPFVPEFIHPIQNIITVSYTANILYNAANMVNNTINIPYAIYNYIKNYTKDNSVYTKVENTYPTKLVITTSIIAVISVLGFLINKKQSSQNQNELLILSNEKVSEISNKNLAPIPNEKVLEMPKITIEEAKEKICNILKKIDNFLTIALNTKVTLNNKSFKYNLMQLGNLVKNIEQYCKDNNLLNKQNNSFLNKVLFKKSINNYLIEILIKIKKQYNQIAEKNNLVSKLKKHQENYNFYVYQHKLNNDLNNDIKTLKIDLTKNIEELKSNFSIKRQNLSNDLFADNYKIIENELNSLKNDALKPNNSMLKYNGLIDIMLNQIKEIEEISKQQDIQKNIIQDIANLNFEKLYLITNEIVSKASEILSKGHNKNILNGKNFSIQWQRNNINNKLGSPVIRSQMPDKTRIDSPPVAQLQISDQTRIGSPVTRSRKKNRDKLISNITLSQTSEKLR